MHDRPRRRPLYVVVGVLLVAAFGVSFAFVPHVFAGHNRHTARAEPTTPSPTSGSSSASPSPAPSSDLAAEIAQLASAPLVKPASSGRITGEATTQPDLYAAAFVQHLLTQDYASPRVDLLAWVQGESAQTTEPLVVGLVPQSLRSRLAVFSVTDDSDSAALVPTASQWDALGREDAHTAVTIDKVSEPLAWTDAVAGGRITDPGVTAREVDATLTRHTGSATTRTSLAVTLHLEGPPTRADWRFVTVVDVRAVPEAAS